MSRTGVAMVVAVAVVTVSCSSGAGSARPTPTTASAPTTTNAPSTASNPPTLSAAAVPAPAEQLSLLVEPDQGIAPIYALIGSARKTLDLTMYELVDTAAESALEQAAGRGVDVRVVLDTNDERAANQPAFEELTDLGVHVVWADPSYAATHEKAMVIDDSVAAIMSLNLTSRYYSSTRDFAVIDTNKADVASVEQVFNADYNHLSITPNPATDLVWSPRESQPALLAVINSSTSTLLVENEEMADSAVTAALVAAAHRGVRVVVVMTDQSEWHAAFATLVAAHIDVQTYAATATLYIHAKAIVADAGTPRQRAFMGSENFSAASLNHNRELGLVTADPGIVHGLATTITDDANAAATWKP